MTRPFPTRRLFMAGTAAILATPALARPRAVAPTYPLLVAPPPGYRTNRRDVVVDGHAYSLFTAIPAGDAPVAGWPSLWMLDGNAAFNRLQAGDLAAHPALAVVCVGYPNDAEIVGDRRTLDYTPHLPSGTVEPRLRGRPHGGADAFRARLTGPLRAAVTEGMHADPARMTLWGHSFGGLFTLGTLFAAPEAFSAYAAISPSTGFGGGVLRDAERTAHPAPHGTRLLVQAGDNEGRTEAPTGPPATTTAMVERLDARGDLDMRFQVIRGASHGQTFRASFPATFDLAAQRDA